MKILNDLSIKDIKLNKKRSLVIIIGIILSTALICGVAGIVTSFQNSIIQYYKEKQGDYHTIFYEVPKGELKYIEENRNVDKYYLSEDLGYAKLENSQNKEKPYVNVISMNNGYLNNMGIHLLEGKMPENSSEIVIPKHIMQNANVEYKIGDSITLDIGQRQLTTGEKLTQKNSYLTDTQDDEGTVLEEEIVNTAKKEYKIVGIIERPSMTIEGYSAPGYTVITKMEEVEENANIAVLYKKVSKYQEYTEQINEMVKATTEEEKGKGVQFSALRDAVYVSYKYDVELNFDLLAFEGANLSDNTMSTLYGVGGVIMAIILVSSIFVIRNGFAISITERLKQYGMLASIGATKKQIKKSVYFEGFTLGLIGIPLGIVSGIFAIDILLKVVNYILKDYIDNIKLSYSISVFAIGISIAISVITIWLSCRSSAKKASKITPIEAIRNTEDIKLKSKKIKCPKIITKIFKTGGEIAYKNLKRSKKKYRTTVISIIVSIVIFITISSFIQYAFKMAGNYYTERDYNISVTELARENSKKEDLKSVYKRFLEISKLDGVEDWSIKRTMPIYVDSDNYLTDFGKMLSSRIYSEDENGEKIKDSLIMIALGKNEYNRFINKIGGKYDEYKDGAILVDNCLSYDENGKTQEGNLYSWEKGDTITGTIKEKLDSGTKKQNEKDNKKIEKQESIKIVDKTNVRPMGMEEKYNNIAYLIVSDEYIEKIGYNNVNGMDIQAKDSYKVEDEIKELYKSKNIGEGDFIVANIDAYVKEQNAMALVISIFLYGFISVITLIGITNIFNTITTNMNLRKKEFAMLKSVGMTKKEFDRMIRLESVFYGLKSLIIGIPIGVGLSYFVYNMFKVDLGMSFSVPVKPILISVIFVVVVVGVIMRYSMRKINKQNIIETIRNDNI